VRGIDRFGTVGEPGRRRSLRRFSVPQVHLVDQHGVVPDILVQERRDGAAAKRIFKHLL
jgi:hypothetical protein